MTIEIKVCMGSACFARGNCSNAEIIEKYIQENNLDAKIELYGARCENKCENGPHIYIDGTCFDNVDEEKLNGILERLNND